MAKRKVKTVKTNIKKHVTTKSGKKLFPTSCQLPGAKTGCGVAVGLSTLSGLEPSKYPQSRRGQGIGIKDVKKFASTHVKLNIDRKVKEKEQYNTKKANSSIVNVRKKIKKNEDYITAFKGKTLEDLINNPSSGGTLANDSISHAGYKWLTLKERKLPKLGKNRQPVKLQPKTKLPKKGNISPDRKGNISPDRLEQALQDGRGVAFRMGNRNLGHIIGLSDIQKTPAGEYEVHLNDPYGDKPMITKLKYDDTKKKKPFGISARSGHDMVDQTWVTYKKGNKKDKETAGKKYRPVYTQNEIAALKASYPQSGAKVEKKQTTQTQNDPLFTKRVQDRIQAMTSLSAPSQQTSRRRP